MSDVMLALVVQSCESAVKNCNGDLKSKLLVAMKEAKNHFMVTDKDTQLRGAIGAVMSFYGKDSDEWRRLEREVDMLRKFSAFLQATQSGLVVEPPELDESAEPPIGILGMWREVTCE
jgi:hypothetical protein